MKQYLEMLQSIMDEGYFTGDRTGVGTQALPGYHYRMRLMADENGTIHDFPLLTTKKVFMRGTFEELMWKLRGETNIASLVEKGVHIWSEWPFKKWLESTGEIDKFKWYVDDEKSEYTQEWKDRLHAFEQMVISDPENRHWGELGPTYGHHMRSFGEIIDPYNETVVSGIDQLKQVTTAIRNNPSDRRIIMSLWNPRDNKSTLLPPCPCFYQFFANQEGYLHMNVYQRSCDSFLGVPFNDSQDAMLLVLLAKVTGRKPGNFNHFFGDVHVYNNHRKQVEEQLKRTPSKLPSIRINRETDNILDFEWKDIEIIGYNPQPAIKAPVAV